ncbi:YhcH/YjgK/YiaL family protein [Sodalis sp. dw_96]|uniref:YhcH/YjgK/YiaL family protein n=1 Tax=Sodalis sp. dw_96 TaxID=2719794 RepID=UPI001BD3BB5A|nr:YhcH/YjgK/YiaL family protein [Sodalis sp. dw_96]
MILDELTSATENSLYHPIIRRTLRVISTLDLANLPAGEAEIEGRDIYLNHIIARTKMLAEQQPELHRHYIDLHILLEGREIIGAATSHQGQRPSTDFDQEKDFGLYEGFSDETLLSLTPGNIALLFPGELHRPMSTLTQPAPIRKIVVKIARYLLDA